MTSDALMTQVLPTTIGSAVITHTIDTTFGRGKNKVHKRTVTRTVKVKGRVVHKGSRGGKYIVRHGKRVYI